jgi:hypothetical protein
MVAYLIEGILDHLVEVRVTYLKETAGIGAGIDADRRLFGSAHLGPGYPIFPAVRLVRLRRISFTGCADPSSPSSRHRRDSTASEYCETI